MSKKICNANKNGYKSSNQPFILFAMHHKSITVWSIDFDLIGKKDVTIRKKGEKSTTIVTTSTIIFIHFFVSFPVFIYILHIYSLSFCIYTFYFIVSYLDAVKRLGFNVKIV